MRFYQKPQPGMVQVRDRATGQVLGWSYPPGHTQMMRPPTDPFQQEQMGVPTAPPPEEPEPRDETPLEFDVEEAADMYAKGIISPHRAAKLAGMSKAEFLAYCNAHKITQFQYTAEDIKEELKQ